MKTTKQKKKWASLGHRVDPQVKRVIEILAKRWNCSERLVIEIAIKKAFGPGGEA